MILNVCHFQKIIGRNTKSQRKRKVKVENTRKGKKSRDRKQKGKVIL